MTIDAMTTRDRDGSVWLTTAAYAAMMEPLMLEVQRRLRPQVVWERKLTRWQNIITLPFWGAGCEWLELSCHLHGETTTGWRSSLYITLNTPRHPCDDVRLVAHSPLESWHLSQRDSSANWGRSSGHGQLCCFRLDHGGSRFRHYGFRHDHPAIPPNIHTDWQWPHLPLLADDIVRVTQEYLEAARVAA